MKQETTISKLKRLVKTYEHRRTAFRGRLDAMKEQFQLSKEQAREVDFGIIIPADRSLQKYADLLNADPELNMLFDQLMDSILEGCVEIMKEILSEGRQLPGYDLDAFINDPLENKEEIYALMQGLGGYRHIHTIDEKIALEIPAGDYLKKNKKLMRAVRFWVKNVEEFGMW